MAATFLEPGGDADFLVGTTNGFWQVNSGSVAVATDFVHGSHVKSIKPVSSGGTVSYVVTPNAVVSDSGGRFSFYIYLVSNPTIISLQFAGVEQISDGSGIFDLYISTAGVLSAKTSSGTQIGSNGPTIPVGVWTRISGAFTITSTTVNRFEFFVNGISAISGTNVTLTNVTSSCIYLGRINVTGTQDIRLSDIYTDKSSSLTDMGNIWVTAKRPFSNGTTNGFTTQIGSGGSGYGSGHAPQVNERPLSTTNGWSMIGAGAAITEEYSIEGAAVGDIDISAATIVDWMAWASQSAVVSETGTFIYGGSTSTYATGTAANVVSKIAGLTTYPVGGTDVGVKTSTDLTTFSLYECGIIIAYIPAAATTLNSTLPTLMAG